MPPRVPAGGAAAAERKDTEIPTGRMAREGFQMLLEGTDGNEGREMGING